jgi:hypothetical protein
MCVWGSATALTSWAIGPHNPDPGPLQVLAVPPAHAQGAAYATDVGDAIARAQAAYHANVNTLQVAALTEAARKAQVAAAAQAAARRAAPPAPRPAPRPVSGDCASWLAAAGVTDMTSATNLIQRESGCNPYAVNRTSGACGVAQEVPCGKSGCSSGDGACQVQWMNGYVLARYSSWANALAFQIANGWY